jgi:uncharacterized membrane protein
MRTPARISSHPIHPMLIPFPIGLLIFSLVCDLLSLGSNDPGTWATVAFYSMVGGFIGALVAAIPAVIDLLSLAERRVKKIALTHMAINLVAVTLYAVNIALRVTRGDNHGVPLLLSVAAVVLLGISGWLGGEMVYAHGVGVDSEPNARSSDQISTRL